LASISMRVKSTLELSFQVGILSLMGSQCLSLLKKLTSIKKLW